MTKIQIMIDEYIRCSIKINKPRLMKMEIKIKKIPRKKKSLAATKLSTPKRRGNRLCIQL